MKRNKVSGFYPEVPGFTELDIWDARILWPTMENAQLDLSGGERILA
jgi:hypothetical protein